MRSLLSPDLTSGVMLEPSAHSFSIPSCWQHLAQALPLLENDSAGFWPVVNLRYQRTENTILTTMWHKKREKGDSVEKELGFANVLVVALELPGFHIENMRIRVIQVGGVSYLFIAGKEDSEQLHYNFFFSYWVPTEGRLPHPKMQDGIAKIKYFW